MGQVKQMGLQARARKSGRLLSQRLNSGEEHGLWVLCLCSNLILLNLESHFPCLCLRFLVCEMDNCYFRGLWKSKGVKSAYKSIWHVVPVNKPWPMLVLLPRIPLQG